MRTFYQLLDGYLDASGSEREEWDRKIWERYGAERAVFVLDMSGFSLQVRTIGLLRFLSKVRRMQRCVEEVLAEYEGELVKFEADNAFAVFSDPTRAVGAAVAIRVRFEEGNRTIAADERIEASMGLAWGNVLLVPGKELFGDAVNLASKLAEDLAVASEILMTRDLAQRVGPHWKLEPAQFVVSGIELSAARLVG